MRVRLYDDNPQKVQFKNSQSQKTVVLISTKMFTFIYTKNLFLGFLQNSTPESTF